MIPQLSQQTVDEYASDALTIQKPEGSDYSQGVMVGKTIPAKWWNWLFNAVTKRVRQSKTDAQDMLTELQNTVTDAGISLDATDNTQLSQAIDAKADTQIVEYVTAKRKFATLWQKVDMKGLYPVPSPSYSQDYQWTFEPQKIDDIYWTVNGTSTSIGGSPTVEGYVAFSHDLENWRLFDPRTIDSSLGTGYGFTVSLIKFKGTYYMCLTYATGSAYLSPYKYVILSSADTESWQVEVSFSASTSFGEPNLSGGCIFVAGNKIVCIAGKRAYISDGTSWPYTSISNQMRASANYDLANIIANVIPVGSKYLAGCVLVDGSTLTPLVTESSSFAFAYADAKTYKLQQGNIIVIMPNSNVNEPALYTVDDNLTVTPSSLNGLVKSILDNNHYVVIEKQNGGYAFTEDGITFTDLPADISNAVTPVCELNGAFYYVPTGSRSILKSTDLVNWVDTGNLVPANTKLYSLPEAGVLVAGNQVSYNEGTTWLQSKDSDDNNYCGTGIFTKLNNKFYTNDSLTKRSGDDFVYYRRLLYITNYVNRVLGYTLYLR